MYYFTYYFSDNVISQIFIEKHVNKQNYIFSLISHKIVSANSQKSFHWGHIASGTVRPAMIEAYQYNQFHEKDINKWLDQVAMLAWLLWIYL
jgi:hypothetical protein